MNLPIVYKIISHPRTEIIQITSRKCPLLRLLWQSLRWWLLRLHLIFDMHIVRATNEILLRAVVVDCRIANDALVLHVQRHRGRRVFAAAAAVLALACVCVVLVVIVLGAGFGGRQRSLSSEEFEEGMEGWDAGGNDNDVCFDTAQRSLAMNP